MDKEFAAFQRQMMEGVNEAMASSIVMTAIVPFIQSEMGAWDNYVSALCREDSDLSEIGKAELADKMLAERRKRFNWASIQARIIEALREPEPIMFCGKLIGQRGACTRPVDHDGGCE
jgi:hypothetical protein